jgi:Ca-activated chloride channel family protein
MNVSDPSNHKTQPTTAMTMNRNPSAADLPEFEEWHLTALALGELSPELADATRRRLEADPELAKQLSEIQSTLAWIERDLKQSPAVAGLDDERRENVLAQIRSVSNGTSNPSVALPTAGGTKSFWTTWRAAGTLGALALAASVIVMLQMSSTLDFRSGVAHRAPTTSAPATSAPATSAPAMVLPEAEAMQAEDHKTGALSANLPSDESTEEKVAEFSLRQDADEIRQATEQASRAAPTASDSAGKSMRFNLGFNEQSELSASSSVADRLADQPLSKSNAPVPLPSALPSGGGGAPGAVPMSAGGDVGRRDGFRSEEIETRLSNEELLERGLSTQGDFPELHEQIDYAIPDQLRANVPSLRRRESKVGDRFDAIPETPFASVNQQPLSTFSIDVDTASYSKLRQYVLEQQTLPAADTIRIEEWINYFDYAYPGPVDDSPFAAHLRLAPCPWNPEHKLVRVAIQARKRDTEERPNSNLVFLIDVSGSMSDTNKLPLVKRTLNLLTHQLREQDRVAIVVYAGAAGCVLPSTSGANKETILASINELQSGGSTNGGEGIQLAYRIAKENFIPGGVNRVLLCTDGDFNVGMTGTDQLIAMMKENAQSNIFLSVLGYGIGNYNDAMMEQVSNQGNGTYAMIDSELEAKRVMVEQLSGTLMTVAKDVKIQVEFNPERVGSYRLIGYENRRLAAKDFDDDRKDAGEIGAGHRVTALYEVIPVGAASSQGETLSLRYAKKDPTEKLLADKPNAERPNADNAAAPPSMADEWLYLKIRSKRPEASESSLQDFVLRDSDVDSYDNDRSDMDWATSVAEFGLLMRRSQLAEGADWERMLSRAIESAGSDPYRRECILIMQQSRRLMGK